VEKKQGAFLLAVLLAAPAFAFADDISGHSKGGNKYVTLSEGLTGQQDLQESSARCNFLFSSPKENGVQTTSIAGASLSEIAKGGGGSNLGAPGSQPATLLTSGANEGASSGNGKGKGLGKQNGGAGDGIGTAAGSGGASPTVPIAEPSSQTLLLFGLAGLGMLAYRRKALTNAI
jgi:hypothetical protein